MLRLVRLAAFAVTALSVAWAIRLVAFRGITVVIGGQLVRSNDPWRPLEGAVGSAVVFVIAGGIPATVRVWRRLGGTSAILRAIGRFISSQRTALVIAAAVFATGALYATTVASGAD
ncbi:MAG TPA: hypothetical protein VIX35_12035, partial [Vicinamibacterales bacterium]